MTALQTVTVNNQQINVKEYNGQRVTTFKDIDRVHGRPEGTAKRNFLQNAEHLIEGTDYFKLSASQKDEIRTFEIPNRGIILLTETGYLMLVKSMNDSLAWQIQRALVDNYFHGKAEAPPADFIPKTWRGEPVMTIKEFQRLSGTDLSTRSINDKLYETRRTRKKRDYFMLEGAALREFKEENPQYPPRGKHLVLITKSGVEALMRKLKMPGAIPAGILDKPAIETPPQQLQLSDAPDTQDTLDDLDEIRRKLIAIDGMLDAVQLVLTKKQAKTARKGR